MNEAWNALFSPAVLGYLAAAVWALLAVAILAGRVKVRETTLSGPWCWALAACAALAIVELLAAASAIVPDHIAAWRFLAAVGIFSPWMSVLGAKRPQDQAWHFVVASLWGIQALPAAEVLVLRPGQTLAIVDARAWFLLLLVLLAALVYLPTRFALSALLAAAAQAVLVWPFLPWSKGAENSARSVLLAGVLMLCAFAAARFVAQRTGRERSLNRLWLDFRDSFGGLWAARVLERVNAAAVMYAWPFRLGWNGFQNADDAAPLAEIPPQYASDVRQTLINLLRRFVSNAWIDARWERPEHREEEGGIEH